MSNEWDGKVVSSTPCGPIVEMSLGDLLVRKDAEIERLRADLALEKSRIVFQRGEIEKQRAEIERLDLDLQRLSAMGSNNKWLLERLAEQRADNERLREVLREALCGLQYWVPQTEMGYVERSRIMGKVEKTLEGKP